MQLFYSQNITDDFIILDGQEMTHCINALRKKINDFIYITDGRGTLFYSKIIEINSNNCKVLIIDKKKTETKANIHLLISPTKNHKRIEWMVEKVAEIGVHRITFIICKNSIRNRINLKRLNKIALSAMKQTQSNFLLQIDDCLLFEDAFKIINAKGKYIGHLCHKNTPLLSKIIKKESSRCILIGPEGDFDKDEVQYALKQNFIEVSLGSSRLRTETSGIVSATLLNITDE